MLTKRGIGMRGNILGVVVPTGRYDMAGSRWHAHAKSWSRGGGGPTWDDEVILKGPAN